MQLRRSNATLNTPRLLPAIIILLTMGLWFINLGGAAYRDWDEGFYTVVAREMIEKGNWAYPQGIESPFLLKPPLLFWITAWGYQIGGQSELVGRLLPTFLSALGIPLIILIARKAFGRLDIALISGIAFAVIMPAARISRLVMMDGPSTTFLLLMLTGAVKGKNQPIWRIWIGIGMGLAILCKGSLGLLFLVMIMTYMILDSGPRCLACSWLWLGLAIGLAPVFTWYGLQTKHYGSDFLVLTLEQQLTKRVGSGIEGHSQPIWYYMLEICKTTMPMLVFAIAGWMRASQNLKEEWSRILIIPPAIYLSAISLTETKLPWYILPLLPFLAMASAIPLADLWRGNMPKARSFWLTFFVICSITGLFGGLIILAPKRDAFLFLTAFAVFCGFGLAAIATAKRLPGRYIAVGVLSAQYFALASLFSSNAWLWELNESYDVRPVAELIRQHAPAHQSVLLVDDISRPSLEWYCHCKINATTSELVSNTLSDNAILFKDEKQSTTLVMIKRASKLASVLNGEKLGEEGPFNLMRLKLKD